MTNQKTPADAQTGQSDLDAAGVILFEIHGHFLQIADKLGTLSYRLERIVDKLQADIADTQRQIDELKERQDG